jgi:hypothetical protein
VTFDESLFMSMWARLGRFLEIYGPKFWDFQWKSDFQQKTKKTFEEGVTFNERLKRLSRKEWLSSKEFSLKDQAHVGKYILEAVHETLPPTNLPLVAWLDIAPAGSLSYSKFLTW